MGWLLTPFLFKISPVRVPAAQPIVAYLFLVAFTQARHLVMPNAFTGSLFPCALPVFKRAICLFVSVPVASVNYPQKA